MQLSRDIEADAGYGVAGHKGYPEALRRAGRSGPHRRLQGKRGRGTLAQEKPPSVGRFQRGGEGVSRMLPNGQHATLKPLLAQTIVLWSLIYTDEYAIYDRLLDWGYAPTAVSPKRNCLLTWPFSSSCITPDGAARLCFIPSSPFSWLLDSRLER